MKLSEVDLDFVKNYANVYYSEDDDLIEMVIMPAAKGYIKSHTKRSEEELNNYPEVVIAFLVICAYMYDNRSATVSETELNHLLKNTLGMHTFYTL